MRLLFELPSAKTAFQRICGPSRNTCIAKALHQRVRHFLETLELEFENQTNTRPRKWASSNSILHDVNASCEIGFGHREQFLQISGLRHRLDLEAAETGGGRLCSLHRGAFDETLGLTDAEVPKLLRLAGVCTRHFGSILNDSLQVGPSLASIE